MDVQQVIELAVLRAIERTSYVDTEAVAAQVRAADARDVDRAVELLVREGAIVVEPSGAVTQAGIPFVLTALGRERLAEQE